MLASTTKALPPGSGWVYELKLDGYRMIADLRDTEARLWSRGGHDYSARFKSVAEALPAAVAAPCVIDSEVCALDAQGHSSFSLLQAGQGTLAAFCFDLLELDGRDVTGLPLEERRELLSQVVTPGPVVRISHTYHDGAALLAEAQRRGLEGVMVKRSGSPYRPGSRTRDWLKLKLKQRDSFTIAGYTAGTGSRSAFGALVLAESVAGALAWRGDVGTGFSDDDLDRLTALLKPLETDTPQVVRTRPGRSTWVQPALRCVVEYAERTAQGRLRAPVYIGLDAGQAPPPAPSRFTPTNPDKVFFPELGITKGELISYYLDVAPALVEHLRARPFTMKRYPDGIDGKHFFQKDAPSHMPEWITRSHQEGIGFPIVDSPDALAWMVNMGCIDMNAWSARADRPTGPTGSCSTSTRPRAPSSERGRGGAAASHSTACARTGGLSQDLGSRGIHVLVPMPAATTRTPSATSPTRSHGHWRTPRPSWSPPSGSAHAGTAC